MKPVKISQKDYNKWAVYPQIKQLMDQSIAAGLLIIKDAPAPTPTPEPTPVLLPDYQHYQWDATKLCIAGVDRNFPDYDPKQVCAYALRAGCNAVSIEMVANDRYFTLGADKVRDPYLRLLAECRKSKLVLFVCVWNDWANNKYIKSHAEKFLSYVLEAGPEGQIIQCVGEIHTSQGQAFEDRAFSALKAKGYKLCYNGSGGQPKSKPSKYDYLAYHSPGTVDRCDAPRGSIEITDHGEKIRDIGFISVSKVEKIARNAKVRGAGFGFYLYVGMDDNGAPKTLSLDKVFPAWVAMGNVYKTAVATQPPVSSSKDAIDISGVIEASTGNIINEQAVPITHQLKSAKSDGKYVVLTNDLPASFYGPDTANRVSDLARCYIYWQRDGKVYGGHFDWLRPGSTKKELKNAIGAGTNDYFKVKWKGEQPYFMIVSSNGKQRTNVVRG